MNIESGSAHPDEMEYLENGPFLNVHIHLTCLDLGYSDPGYRLAAWEQKGPILELPLPEI